MPISDESTCIQSGVLHQSGWVERDAQWLLRLLCKRLRIAPAEAADIAQDTWVRALQAHHSNIGYPRAFLARIALNLFRDSERRERLRREKQHLLEANDCRFLGQADLHDQEATALLEQIIVTLPEPLRDVFVLSRFQCMTNRDIAAHLGISAKTVELRISKAMAHCMAKLQD